MSTRLRSIVVVHLTCNQKVGSATLPGGSILLGTIMANDQNNNNGPKHCTDLECIKKHKLPADDLDEAFEIASIELDSPWFLREIRRKIVEKLDTFCDIIRVIIEPETSLADMHESKSFTSEEKNDLIILYKMIMIMKKDAQLLDIDSKDKKEAAFIKEVMVAYPEIKKRMTHLVERTREAWTKETDEKKDLGYLG